MRGNPKFVAASAQGTAMQLAPPFHFDGVTVRLFPLRASRQHLQRFIDKYLNIAPPQVARFRVPIPFVYLMLINYGRMAVDAANLGWISQREIAFCVPLEWYKLRNGKYDFIDWATICPFIYVDNPLSMSTGREVYGWPKTIARLDEELNAWMENPLAKPRLAKVSAMLFPSAYQGQRQEPRVFLEVVHGPSPQALRVPLDSHNPALPWNALPNLIRSGMDLGGDALGILTGMGVLQRQPGLDLADYGAMGRKLGQLFNPRDLNVVANTVNLKQFRAADAPGSACYQALTNAPMAITRYKNGGMLGDANLLLGDASGGYSVLLHRYASTPVIETLGLEVDTEWRGADATVARLKPVLPCWYDVDMRYDRPETLAWRTKDSAGWIEGTGESARAWSKRDKGEAREPNAYTTVTGAAGQEVAGPFDFPDSTLRVLPLLAQEDKLKKLARDLFNVPLKAEAIRLEPWGRYVYMIVGSHNGVSSDTNNIGWWADRDVTFYVPMKMYTFEDGAPEGDDDAFPYRGKPGAQLQQVVIVPVFSYANSTTAAISLSEVSGVPVMQATINCPEGPWMNSGGPSESVSRQLMDLSTTVLPVIGEGQGAEVRRLIEVTDGLVLPPEDTAGWRRISESWGDALRQEVQSQWSRREEGGELFDDALSVALVMGEVSAASLALTMKQFRDGAHPEDACYQSLVGLRREFKRVHDFREIEEKLTVRIHDYPTQPIVEDLGLIAKHVSYGGGARVYCLEPLRPFWIRASIRDHLGETLRHRAGSEIWQDNRDEAARRRPGVSQWVGRVSAGFATEVFPRRISAQVGGVLPLGVPPNAVFGSVDGLPTTDRPTVCASVVAEAIERFDMQMFLGAALSREWENWGDNTRWSDALDTIRQELQTATQDVVPMDYDKSLLNFLTAHVERLEEQGSLPGGEKLVSRRERCRYLLKSLDEERLRLVGLRGHAHEVRLREYAHFAADHLLYRAAVRALSRLGPAVRDESALAELKAEFQPMHDTLAKFRADALIAIQTGTAIEPPGALEPIAERLALNSIETDRNSFEHRASLLNALCDRVEWMITTVRDLPERVHGRVRAVIIQDTRREFAQNREQLLHNIALSRQKPDHCALAENLPLPERDYLLPREHSWCAGGQRWYRGPTTRLPNPLPYRMRMRVPAQGGTVTADFSDEASSRGMGPIRRVAVWVGDVIDSIQVTCELGAMPRHGGTGGARREVEITTEERFVALRVWYGNYFGAVHLLQLEFTLIDKAGARRIERISGHQMNPHARDFSMEVPDFEHNLDEIGAFFGGTWLHTDGTEALSRLGAVIIGPLGPADAISSTTEADPDSISAPPPAPEGG